MLSQIDYGILGQTATYLPGCLAASYVVFGVMSLPPGFPSFQHTTIIDYSRESA
jgi:hypothetical protein